MRGEASAEIGFERRSRGGKGRQCAAMGEKELSGGSERGLGGSHRSGPKGLARLCHLAALQPDVLTRLWRCKSGTIQAPAL